MSRRTLITIIILASLGLLAYVGFLVYRQYFTFQMTGTNPHTSKVLTFTPYMDVNFNKTLVNYEEFLVTSDSPEILQKVEFRDKSIRIYLENMTLDATYTIEFTPVRAEDGNEISNLSLQFTTKMGNFEDLPKEQQDHILKEQDELLPPTHTDPILQHIPYSTLTFELRPFVTQGDEGHDVLILEARLLLSAADARINADAAAAQYKREVLDYIRSLDLDPKDYTIEYEVVVPTL